MVRDGEGYSARLQACLCGEQSGAIRSPAHYRRRLKAEETAKHQAGTPSQDARPGGAGRRMAEERAQRLLPIPCSPGESDRADAIPATGRRYWSMRWDSAAKGGPTGKSRGNYSIKWLPAPHVVHEFPDARFHAKPSCGGISEVRTVCGSAASTSLCAGVAGNGHPYRDGFCHKLTRLSPAYPGLPRGQFGLYSLRVCRSPRRPCARVPAASSRLEYL
jgi:hypothetical protein